MVENQFDTLEENNELRGAEEVEDFTAFGDDEEE